MTQQSQHEHGTESETGHKKRYNYQEVAGILGILAGAACVLGYIMSLDPRGRHGAILAFLIAWFLFGLVIAALYWEPRAAETEPKPPSEGPDEARAVPSARKPRFSERSPDVTMIIGGNSMTNPYREGAVMNLARIGNARVSGRMQNGELLVSADLPNGVKLVDNELQNKPPQWDRNFDDQALEVVDENRFPVFQIAYPNDHTAVINGLFDGGNGRLFLATETGLIIGPRKSDFEENPIHRLFKYPSYRFQGVREKQDR